MQGSLAKLVEELKISCLSENDLKQEFFPLWNWIQENWEKESYEAQIEYLNLLTKKQYLPYSYLTSEEVLSQTLCQVLKNGIKAMISELKQRKLSMIMLLTPLKS